MHLDIYETNLVAMVGFGLLLWVIDLPWQTLSYC